MVRRQHLPWRAAGRATERIESANAVLRETGWVFDGATGSHLTLESFVHGGEVEVASYMHHFGLANADNHRQTMVEIGAGIGRMTVGFTQRFSRVVACDLDASFLERCRETVARFGEVGRLQTSLVPDGCRLSLADGGADLVFSYITLQHCAREDALALVAEAARVARTGGQLALNFRQRSAGDALVMPIAKLARAMWRLPVLGPRLSRWRAFVRLGWQSDRLSPREVLAELVARGVALHDVTLFQHPRRKARVVPGATMKTYEGVHRSHWWLIAKV